MITRAQIVAEARTWLGTPFRHQGRMKTVAVDCIGIVIGVAHALGISDYDTTDYGMMPDSKRMRLGMRAHLSEIAFIDALPGDILWFRIATEPQHVAIITELEPELSILHAYSRSGVMRCVEQPMGALWRKLVVGSFRYRGIA